MAVYFNAAKVMINSLMATVFLADAFFISRYTWQLSWKNNHCPHNLRCGFDGIELTVE